MVEKIWPEDNNALKAHADGNIQIPVHPSSIDNLNLWFGLCCCCCCLFLFIPKMIRKCFVRKKRRRRNVHLAKREIHDHQFFFFPLLQRFLLNFTMLHTTEEKRRGVKKKTTFIQKTKVKLHKASLLCSLRRVKEASRREIEKRQNTVRIFRDLLFGIFLVFVILLVSLLLFHFNAKPERKERNESEDNNNNNKIVPFEILEQCKREREREQKTFGYCNAYIHRTCYALVPQYAQVYRNKRR